MLKVILCLYFVAFLQRWLQNAGAVEPVMVWPDHTGWHWSSGQGMQCFTSTVPPRLHAGTLMSHTSRIRPWYSFSFGGHLDLSLMSVSASLIHHRGHFSHLKNELYGIIKFQVPVVQHESIIIIVECYFLLAYSSTHSQIYNEISDGWNTFSMIPAGRWSTEAPSKTLPRTHHHQYAVLHSKADIGIWVEGC